MRLKLWQRLFLVQTGLIGLALAALVWAQQRSFQHGLLDYLNGLDRQRAELLAQRLANLHNRAGGSFAALQHRPALLRLLVIGLENPDRERFERPQFKLRQLEQGVELRPPLPQGARPMLGRKDSVDFLARLAVVNAQAELQAGNAHVLAEPERLQIPILSAGQPVGSVLLAPLPTLATGAELQFAQAQLRTALWSVLLVLALALAAALWLARRLLAPLHAVSSAAKALAAGQHTARATVLSHDEVGQLAEDFNRLAETLECNRQSRQRWIADISHELRTPLAILIGEMQALEDGVRPLDVKALGSLQAEAARIRQLVDDLYQLALADAGALEYRFVPVDLAALLGEIVELHQGAFHQAGLQLQAELPASPAMVRADAVRLRQLFGNLLANTLRYTERGGRAQWQLARVGARWQIQLDDSAPGVPDAALPQLFERLFRADPSRSRAAGGAGLGLSIAREIVLAHRGTISASHSTLGGLRISILLP